MGSSKNKSTSKSSSTFSQNSSTIGAPQAQQQLGNIQALSDQVMGQQAFTGDRVATTPELSNYVAQWGAAPSTFVPQQTATSEAQKAGVTWVDPNAQEGIDAGMAAAAANQARIPGITENLYDYWGNIAAGGGQNPYLQDVINSFSTDFNEQQARQRNQRAFQAGAEGAFGGSGFHQGEAWAEEQAAQAYGSQVAGLRYQDFLNTQNLMNQSPAQLAAIAQLNTLPAEQFARYGGMRQENLAGQAATADENAQRDIYNQWLEANLADQNARNAAQEALAQWEAQYRIDDAATRDAIARAQVQQGNAQAGLDNEYLRWLTGQETLNNQIMGQGSIADIIASLGSNQTTTSGKQDSKSTTETKQTAAPWQIAAGLGGAALSAFGGGAGGLFSGSLSALGKAPATLASIAPTQFSMLPSLNPLYAPPIRG